MLDLVLLEKGEQIKIEEMGCFEGIKFGN